MTIKKGLLPTPSAAMAKPVMKWERAAYKPKSLIPSKSKQQRHSCKSHFGGELVEAASYNVIRLKQWRRI